MIRNYDKNALLESSGVALLFNLILSVMLPFFFFNKSFISCKKITTFSAQKFLQGKNKDKTMVGHIEEFVRRLGNSWAAMFYVVAFSLSNS